jgi:hypothetical protein
MEDIERDKFDDGAKRPPSGFLGVPAVAEDISGQGFLKGVD